MTIPTFTDRNYRLGEARLGQGVLCDTTTDPADLEALRDALAWRRNALSLAEFEDADSILALRALIALDDRMLESSEMGEGAYLTVSRDDVLLLAEITGGYIAERDIDGYQSLKERNRLERLRALSGRLMDVCSEFVAAEDEARASSFPA